MSDIKIIIDADVKGLEAGTKKVQAELGKTAIAAQKTDSSVAKMGAGLQQTGGLAQKAATNISNLGASLISGGIIAGVAALGLGIYELGKKIGGLTEEQKRFTEVLEGAKSAYVKAVTQVDNMRDAFQKAKDGVISKKEALKIYNSTIGKTIGQTDDLNEAEQLFIDNSDDFVKYTFLRAAAQVAAARSAEKLVDAEIKRRTGVKKPGLLDFILNPAQYATGNRAIDNLNDRKKDIAESLNYDNIAKSFRAEMKIISDTWKKTPPIAPIPEIKVKVKKVKVEADEIDYKPIFKKLEGPDSRIEVRPKVVIKPLVVLDSANFTEAMRVELESSMAAMEDFLLTSAVSGVTTVMDGLADVITGKGGIGDMFEGLAKFLGSNIKQLGQQVLQIAILAALAKKAIKNPYTGVVAGIALIALGALIESATTKNAFASGVRGFSGGTALVGERGPELVQLPRGANVVPNNEVAAYGGGGGNWEFATKISGVDLEILRRRAVGQMGRNN